MIWGKMIFCYVLIFYYFDHANESSSQEKEYENGEKKMEEWLEEVKTRHTLRPFSSKSPMKMYRFDYVFPINSYYLFYCRSLTKCNMGFHRYQLSRTSHNTDFTITLHSDYIESNIFGSKFTYYTPFSKWWINIFYSEKKWKQQTYQY